jgi:hypothetical protein
VFASLDSLSRPITFHHYVNQECSPPGSFGAPVGAQGSTFEAKRVRKRVDIEKCDS